ncbi:MAG TPA: hypothetical protein VFA30_10980 [Gaiellaceae bacterium]|nr:hypothetical protein [Gaiellaceae bacterium]
MTDRTQTRPGTCPTHGGVAGERTVPTPGFPFLVYAVRRLVAARKPYVCPECGVPVRS